MKRKLLSFALTAAMVLSLTAPVEVSAAGASGVPDDFMKPLTLPLMPAAKGELYDEPALELPRAEERGFIAEVEGGAPSMPDSGLMAQVGEAPDGATEIATAQQLQAMTKGTYVLTQDIDLTGVAWTPINLTTSKSDVVLDGQGHTVKGLTVTAVSEDDYGLFGYVYGNVTVKNLRLDDVTLNLAVSEESSTSEYGVGALFGRVKGMVKLDNVAADVAVARTGAYICKIGGLVGMSSSTATVSDVAVQVSMPEADAAPAGIAHYPCIGGIAGELTGACSFKRCYAEVDLYTTNWSYNKPYGMGGMVGYIAGGHKVTAFTDCMVEGTLVSADHRAGGLAGGVVGGLKLTNCVVEADVTGREAGGYCAYLQNYNTDSSCVNCRYSGTLTLNTIRDSFVGGFFGYGSANFTSCAADVSMEVSDATSKTCYAGGLMGDGGGVITSCELDVDVSDFSGTSLFLGGAVGDGTSTVTDTAVTLDVVEMKNAAGAANIGGLVGGDYSTNLTAKNCGATVYVNYTVPGEASVLYTGGLLGRGGGKMVKCWADGNILLHNYGTDGAQYYLGGLAGSGGPMSQCWAGVDIFCAYCPDNTAGYGYVGGLAGDGSSMFSCWSDAKISADGRTMLENVGGLCGHSNGATYRDCTFTGTVEGIKAVALGGILGSCQNGYFYNCYVDNDLETGKRVGGLLGQASHTTVFSDCRFEGSVTAMEGGGAGGLISASDDVLNGTSTLNRCEVSADITAPGGTAHGIAGDVEAYDCEFRGELSGADMGGIGASGSFYDCTATVWLDADQRSAQYMDVGGISSGSAKVVSNCRVTNRLSMSVLMDENRDSLQIRFGGIGGIVTRAVDCETKGVSLRCFGDDSSVDETKQDDRFNIRAGGIAGEMGRGMDNCRVSGNASVSATLGVIYVGGLAGQDVSSVNGSCVTGCVTGGASGSVKKSTVYAGGLHGNGTDQTLISGCVTGGGAAFCHDNQNGAHSGKWTGNDKYDVGSKDLSIPARPDENYTILTFSYPDATETADSTVMPLEGVTVTSKDENGDLKILGKTNSAGMLTVKRDQVGSMYFTVSGSKEGYFSDDSGVALAGGGSTSLYLMERTQGKIYLTSALYTEDDPFSEKDKTVDLLTDPNTVSVLQTDREDQMLYFGVDWNGARADGRVLQLNNEEETKPLDVQANVVEAVNIQSYFDPEDDIYIIAKGYFGSSQEPQKVKLKLNLNVEMLTLRANITTESIPYGPTEEKPGLNFLDGIFVTASFGDAFKWGPKVEVKNQTVTIDFGPTEGTPIESPKGLLNGRTKGYISGKLQLDMGEMHDANYKWAGEIYAKIMLDPLMDHSKPFAVAGIPCSINSTISMGGSFGGGFEGTPDYGTFYGRIGAEGDVQIIAGPGASTEELKILAGPNVGANGTIDHYWKEDGVPDGWTATLIGDLSLKAKLKCGSLIEFEPGFQLGKFKWDETNGAKFYFLGEDITPEASLNSLYWIPDAQTYLSGAVGEVPDAERVLFYENIFESSEQVLTVENGTVVLYFTAEDGQGSAGSVQEHVALWRSELSGEGVWSAPEQITRSGYPDTLDGEGPFAVWVESDKTGDLAQLLTSTDVMVRADGVLTQLTDGTGYVCGVKVSASETGDKALVTWFSDPTVDGVERLISGDERQLCYAAYDGAEWKTGTVNTGARPAVAATPDCDLGCVYWQDADGAVYTGTGASFETVTKLLENTGKTVHKGPYTAAVTGNSLTVWNGGTEEAVVPSGSVSDFVLCQGGDGVFYLVWSSFDGVWYADSATGWANRKQIAAEEQAVRELSAVVTDGLPRVSYYRGTTADSETRLRYDLCVAKSKDFSGTDLALREVRIDSSALARSGVIHLQAEAVNLQESEITDFTYTVTDETGAELVSGTVDDRALGYEHSRTLRVTVPADCTAAHTYTLSVAAAGDENPQNDSLSVTAEPAVEVTNTQFVSAPTGKVSLDAVVGSIGAAPVEEMTVEIFRCASDGTALGEALVSQTFENVPAGSCRQVVLENAVSHQRYKVVVTAEDGQTDNQMLMWKDETLSGIWVSGVSVAADGSASVNLIAQNRAENVRVYLALYRQGKMVSCAAAPVSAWDGGKRVELTLPEAPEPGAYKCGVFVLGTNGLTPVSTGFYEDVTLE